MWRRIKNFLVLEDGPTTVEYAIMLALIVMICFSSILFIGERTNEMFSQANEQAFPEP